MSTTSSNDPSVGRLTADKPVITEVIVTFGYGYKNAPHPTVGVIDPDGWVRVVGDSYGEILQTIRRQFGLHYSSSIPIDRFAKSRHFYPLGELCVVSPNDPQLTPAQMASNISEAKSRSEGK